MYKTLRWIRVGVALVTLLLFILGFTFVGRGLEGILTIARFQFIPALVSFLSGGAFIFVFFLILTLLFGRVYCSLFCPLGIMQDGVSKVASWFKSKKGKRFRYSRPHTTLRVVVCILSFAVLAIFGARFFAWIDPYSNFGKIATQLVDPVFIGINNLLAKIFPAAIFHRSYSVVVWGSFAFGAAFCLVVVAMSAFRGRLYCNTICPVGTLLGYISKISLFKLAIDKSECIKCNACINVCKSECIDVTTGEVDESRCVVCLNCTTVCKKHGLRFVRRSTLKGDSNTAAEESKKSVNQGRREAIGAIAGLGAVMVARGVQGNRAGDPQREITGIIPPGGVSLEHLKNHCTACQACVEACPNRIISPAFGEYGAANLMLPVIHYKKQFCGFNCNICSNVCPNGALKPLSVEEKRKVQIGRVEFIAKNCIVFKHQTDCGACDEHCPTKAITMKEWKGRPGLYFPTVNPDMCIGCGGCEYVCPEMPKAMVVRPLSVHGEAVPPKEDKQEKKVVSDFGF